MKSLFAILSILLAAPTTFAALNCDQPLHAMDVSKCTFLEVLRKRTNPDIERAKQDLAAKGFSHINVSEEPLAVFVRGDQKRYAYLVMTDVSTQRGFEFKSIGAVISSTVDGQAPSRDVRIEKVITSDSLQ